ncbi:MAG: ABC transporter permease [Ignisphaera sp.]|nr:ABC transporter permease [Ignisphaera sp.]MDW8085600.1 ABC transporter permease [Ignisphaera sp.]
MSKKFIKFLCMRLAFFIVAYIVAITLVFLLPRIIPGNPLALLLTQILQQARVSRPEEIKEVYLVLLREFGLDKPIWMQYLDFLSRAFVGDLGTSISYYPRKVIDLIAPALPWTLAVLVPAILTAWSIGNVMGAVAGYRRGSIFEKVTMTFSFIMTHIPYYWFAMFILFVFGVRLRIFPVGGGYSPWLTPSLTPQFVANLLWHYIPPFLSIVLVSVGSWAIGMRFIVVNELEGDYIIFSESLGVSDKILYRYVFRNSLLPQVTGLALAFGNVLGGQVVMETIFNYPGTGHILFQALVSLDYIVIQGVFIILIATLYLANFIVDFIYVLVDPRIRIGE